jgi:hypothetical protein
MEAKKFLNVSSVEHARLIVQLHGTAIITDQEP